MTYRDSRQWGPLHTPDSLKILLLLTGILSILSSLIHPLHDFLALSAQTLSHLHLWQFITYLWTDPYAQGLSLPFFIHLGFTLYLLWIFGTSLMEKSQKLFFSLYFGGGLVAGLAVYAVMALFHLPDHLGGSSTALYSLLVGWVILFPEAELLLFFAIPFKARWLILGLLGINLMIDLSSRDWIHLTSYVSAILFAYVYLILIEKEHSPFAGLQSFERSLHRFREKVLFFERTKKQKGAKIYDFHSGQPMDADEEFMDQMLARISKQGEDSLSPAEKKRMQQISERKKGHKPPSL